MKTTLSTNEAVDILFEDEYAAWTYQAATALVEYLEELEHETGEEMQLDRVAIRCDFSEYKNALEAVSELSTNDFDTEEEALEWLHNQTLVIEFNGGVIVQTF